ncbi:MAG TPA: hypothetical protein VFV38_18525, partial [Ktedonobacteraceae bacterium]|nr:hypothetical protein [Ktedonobacteraceae bacterium]
MAKLRLLIKQSVRANTCIPVIVDSTDMIGTCISSLVDYLGLPTQDVLGRVLTYSLRPLSGGQPLSNTMRFADAQVLPETRLVLEEGKAYVMTQPIAASLSEGGSAHAKPPPNPLRQFVNRRTFVVGSVLTSCAVSGLLTGIATAFATRGPALPIAMI